MAALFLLTTMLVLMLMRVIVPLGRHAEGKPLREVRLSFRERLLLQRINIYALGAVLLLGALGGWIDPMLELLVIAMAFAILMIPVRYVFTSDGVGLNNTLFRRWEEFGRYTAQGVRLQLSPQSGAGSLTLFIPTEEQREVLKVVKQYVSGHKAGGAAATD